MCRHVATSFGEVAVRQVPELQLRDEVEQDLPFLLALYASTRAEELAAVPWSETQKQAFLAHQFHLQREQYRAHYAGAEWLLIERGGERIGRLYLRRGGQDLRLMDIALLPALRGHGLGTQLTRAVLGWGDALDLPVTLHVEPFNPAYRMYRRLGFAYVRSTGIYHFLERPVGAGPQPDQISRLPRA